MEIHKEVQKCDKKHPFTILIEPFKGCNMTCSYCYSDIYSNEVMNKETIEIIFKRIREFLPEENLVQADIIWHGGEPMCAGTDFYKYVFSLCEKEDYKGIFRHCMQTNGTLINEAWCDLIREHNIMLSISLDGPEEVNNKVRIGKTKEFNNFNIVREKTSLLDKYNIPYNFLVVISRVNVDKPQEIYDFFRSIGKSFKINPLMKSPFMPDIMKDLGVSPQEYGQFLVRLFDIWMNDEDSPVNIGTLDTYIKNVVAKRAFNCQHKEQCVDHMLGIRPDGTIALCTRFEEKSENNIFNSSIKDLREKPPFSYIRKRSFELSDCKECEFYTICYGGCPHHSYAFFGDYMKKDYFCISYKMIYSRIKDFI